MLKSDGTYDGSVYAGPQKTRNGAQRHNGAIVGFFRLP